MPFGDLIASALVAIPALAAIAPRRRPRALASLCFRLGMAINELPFVALYWLVATMALAVVQGDVSASGGWIPQVVAVVAAAELAVIVRRALRARPTIDAALAAGLGAPVPRRGRRPWAAFLLLPFGVRRRDVEHVSDITYGPAGVRNQLDVYRARSRPSGCPVLVYFHGGGFVGGRKNREARPLLYRLASEGWTCISANYRLRPAGQFPDPLVDVKQVIAWVREHGHEYGADPATLFVAGSSAGGFLVSMAALTANDPAFQPGFEHADTSVTAVISLYGYYGEYGRDAPLTSPLSCDATGAPPFFVAHGDLDTLVLVEGARLFVGQLRTGSSHPVVYAELPGAQHSFDRFRTIRFDAVVDGIETFAARVRARQAMPDEGS